jgi:uncharacterized protein YfbU (UPF0304 family)
MGIRTLYISLKHERDIFIRNEIKREMLKRLTNLTEEEAKHILNLLENYIDLQEEYYRVKDKLKQAEEIVKHLCKTLNIT